MIITLPFAFSAGLAATSAVPSTTSSAVTRASTASTVTVTVSISTARPHFVGGLPAILGEDHSELTAVHFVTVQMIHGIHGITAIVKLYEGKTTRALGVVILCGEKTFS